MAAEIKVAYLNDIIFHGIKWRDEIKRCIRSWELSRHTRLEMVFHAIMKSDERVIESLLENGFEESSEAAVAARNEIIQLLMEPGFPGEELETFLVDLTIEYCSSSQGMYRYWSLYSHEPLKRYSVFFLPIGRDKKIDLRLLYRKVRVNEYFGKYGDNTLLGEAVRRNDLRVTRLLLDHGADVNLGKQDRPLHFAMENQVSCEILKLLLNQKNVLVDARSRANVTPLQYYTQWLQKEDKIMLLAQSGAHLDLDHDRDGTSGSILHSMAKRRQCSKQVEWLLKYGANVNHSNEEGRRPLHGAAEEGHEMIAQILIEHGAMKGCQDSAGMTPLMAAAANGHVKVVKLLLEGDIAIDSRESIDAKSATSHSDRQKLPSTVQSGGKTHGTKIQKHEIKFNNKGHGKTNQTNRAKFKINCTARKVSQEYFVDKDDRNREGATAMYQAAEKGHTQIVQILLSQGASADIADYNGDTPLRIAVQRSRWDTADLLIEYGADPNIVNRDSLTALSTVITGKISEFEKREIFTHRLLAYGADVRSLCKHIRTRDGSYDLTNQYDPTTLRATLEYELITDLAWLKKLYNAISYHRPSILLMNHDLKSMKVLAEYTLKLEAAGILQTHRPHDVELKRFLHTVALKILKSDNNFTLDSVKYNFTLDRVKYEVDVVNMTSFIDSNSTTFLDLLSMSANQLACLVRNETLVETLKSSVNKFPFYENILQGRLKKGLLRRERLDAACQVCQLLFNRVLRVPYELTERVVMNLDDRELCRFVLDHERDPFWQKIKEKRKGFPSVS